MADRREVTRCAAVALVVIGVAAGPRTIDAGGVVSIEEITAPDAEQSDFFGLTLDLDDDTLAVGARGEDDGSGAVYVFERSGTEWTEVQKIEGPAPGTSFGRAIALDGDLALVGRHARGVVLELALAGQ